MYSHRRADRGILQSMMPIMSGSEATHIIRTQLPFVADPKIRAIPIICIWAGNVMRWWDNDDILFMPLQSSAVREILQRYSKCQIVRNNFGGIERGPPHFMKIPAWGGLRTRKYMGPRSLL